MTLEEASLVRVGDLVLIRPGACDGIPNGPYRITEITQHQHLRGHYQFWSHWEREAIHPLETHTTFLAETDLDVYHEPITQRRRL